MPEGLEKGAWSPGHPRAALSGAVGAAPGSVWLQTSAGSRCSLCPRGDWPLHHAWSLRAAWELRRPNEGSQAAERGPTHVPQQSRLRVTPVLTLVNVTIAVCSCASLRLPLPPCPPTPAHPGPHLASAHLSAQPPPPPRLSASVAQLTGTPLTSGLGGEAQRARGLEPQQEATQHEAGARDGPHGSSSEGSSRHSGGGRWGPGLINLSARPPSQAAPHWRGGGCPGP